MVEPIEFTLRYGRDGSVIGITADCFPDEIEMSLELLALATKGETFGLRVVGDRLLFDVANGSAEYQLGEPDIGRQVRPAYRASGGLYT